MGPTCPSGLCVCPQVEGTGGLEPAQGLNGCMVTVQGGIGPRGSAPEFWGAVAARGQSDEHVMSPISETFGLSQLEVWK